MGGPKKTRPMLKKKYSRAFESISRQRERAMKYTGQLLVVDVLVKLRSIMIDHRDGSALKLTGFQWVVKLLEIANRAFKQEFATVVLVMDKPALVPPYKAPEEKARGNAKKNAYASKARKADAAGEELPEQIVPFPRGSRLTEAGVEIPADAKNNKPACVELLTMERLLATRALRADLLELMKECLRQYGMGQLGLDEGEARFLIIDSSGKTRGRGGTEDNASDDWRYFSTPASLFSWSGHAELPANKFDHPFGEADLGVLWWTHIFGDMNAVIDSNDTDQYAVWMGYLEYNCRFPKDSPRRRKGTIKLRYPSQETDPTTGRHKDEMCLDDMEELYAGMVASGISGSMFGLYHAIGGNDFSAKRLISNGVSEQTLLDKACKSRHLRAAAAALETEHFVLPEDMQFVWWRTRYPDIEHGQDLKAFARVADYIDEFLRGAQGNKKASLTKEGNRDDAMRMVMWSYQYFGLPMYWFGNAAPRIGSIAALAQSTTWLPYKPAPRVSSAPATAAAAPQTKHKAAAVAEQVQEEHSGSSLLPAVGIVDEDDLFEEEANRVAAEEEADEARNEKSRAVPMDDGD